MTREDSMPNHDPYSQYCRGNFSAPHRGLTRREVLARGVGVTGLLALGGWPELLRAENAPPPPNLPARAKQAPASPVSIQRR